MKALSILKRIIKTFLLLFVVLPVLVFAVYIGYVSHYTPVAPDKLIVNDITQLNPTVVSAIVTPSTNEDVQKAVKNHTGPISIGGGRFSMGGQIATNNTLFIDMQHMNRILEFRPLEKLITVQAGARWKEIQDYIDPDNLSVKIMQTYNNFTVGGSLSVNVHGRYIGQGPLIMSVQSIRMVLADGTLVNASPTENPELFYGAIGGYGGLGVITEATLELADNVTIRRYAEPMLITEYKKYFFDKIRNNKDAVFHNADIYPPDYKDLTAVTWLQASDKVTSDFHFRPVKDSYWLENIFYYWVTDLPFGGMIREKYIDPYLYKDSLIVKRNYEASYDVKELMPLNRGSTTFALQEYFIPVEKFDEFVPKMRGILQKHKVKMMNISVRHARQDPGAVMAWARQEVFAFVMYYKQDTSVEGRAAVGAWTREMIDAALSEGGSYYLPYQPYATQKQFLAAYPDADKFFALKKKYDPDYKFRNKLWDKYYWPDPADRDLAQQEEDTPNYYRTEDQTFLTIPEWDIVFISEQYADALKHPPSAFPYFAEIEQFWSVYNKIRQRTDSEYPPNPGYNLMINVIGVSTAAELCVKGVYENTVGRLTEWISGRGDLTPDMKVESFIYDTNADYVAFIRQHPWYEYPFDKKYDELKSVVESPGTNQTRSAERRLFFACELLFKSAYARAIEKATHAAYAAPDNKTWALVMQNGAKRIAGLPRYQDFTPTAVQGADAGATFIDIAGNKKILLTVIAPKDWVYRGNGETFAEWPILTQPELKRSALLLDVADLTPFIRQIGQNKTIKLDHIFDY